jgi:tRNA(Met) cytidine acetyltransferase
MTMLSELLLELKSNQQRGFIWLSGSQGWTSAWLRSQLNRLTELVNEDDDSFDVIRFSGAATNDFNLSHDIRTKKFKSYLGQESDVLLFDAFAGFNPDAFGALAGTVRKGGVLILISPAKANWPRYPDPELNRVCVEPYQFDQIKHHFITRIVSILETCGSVIDVSENSTLTLPTLRQTSPASATIQANHDTGSTAQSQWQYGCLTSDQEAAVQTVINLAVPFYRLNNEVNNRQRASHAFVLTADRGRGKSTSLAIIASELILQCAAPSDHKINNHDLAADFSIVITCPLADSVNGLIAHFLERMAASGPVIKVSDAVLSGSITLPGRSEVNWHLSFFPPDELGRHLPHADCVFIDEAAAIPIPLLSPVFNHYDCCILASTQNGYEGTGRGFEYKLKPSLQQYFKQVNYINLTQPIRWTQSDILEPIVNRLLALDSFIGSGLNLTAADHNTVNFRCVDRRELAKNVQFTDRIFALLVHAHYRTSPHDLRMMLDSPNIEVWVALLDGQVVAAALIATEGQIRPELAELVAQGRRRPRGHLFPQSLLNHGGYNRAGNYLYGRIVRIAVQPNLQGRGFGRQLIDHIRSSLIDRAYDFICTSFGLTELLLNFWQGNHFKVARLGIKPDASSGELSIMMWQSLSTSSNHFYHDVTSRFESCLIVESNYLPNRTMWLGSLMGHEVKHETLKLSENSDRISTALEPQDIIDLTYLTQHYRLPDNCLLALYRLSRQTDQTDILTAWFEHGYSRSELYQRYRINGQNSWNEAIRKAACIRMQLL